MHETRLPMVKDGYLYAAALSASAVVCGWLAGPWLASPCLILAAFCLYFFRDPERQIPSGDVCVSPADGKVVRIFRETDGRTRISIFLNIFNVHVNRAPIGGQVRSAHYSPGRYRMAHLDAASTENERNTLVIGDTDDGQPVEVTQIAGLVARRIVCHKARGDDVQKGERIGLIKFGSRVDVVVGPEWDLTVKRGDKVAGGSSVLAKRG